MPDMEEDRRTPSTLLTLGVVSVCLLALSIRAVPAPARKTVDPDPYFSIRMARAVLSGGRLPQYDPLSWKGGYGIQLRSPLIYFVLAGSGASWGSVLGTSVPEFACRWLPPILGLVCCLAVFFLARRWFGDNVALLAAFFTAASPAHAFRTLWGFCDKDPLFITLVVCGILFFILARRVPFLAAYLITCLMAVFTTSMYPYLILLSALLLFSRIRGDMDSRILRAYMLGCLVLVLISLSPVTTGFVSHGFAGALVASCVFFLAVHFLHRIRSSRKRRLAVFVGLVLLLAGIVASQWGSLTKELSIFKPRYAVNIGLVIEEWRSTTPRDFLSLLGIGSLLAPVGALVALRRRTYVDAFLLLWLLVTLPLSLYMIRFMLLLSVPAAILSAIGWDWLIRWLRPAIGTSKSASWVVWASTAIALSLAVLSTFSLLCNISPVLSEASVEALRWLGRSSTEGSRVLSWWTEGYFIQTIAGRQTVFDPNTRDSTLLASFARIFSSPSGDPFPLMQQESVSFLYVSEDSKKRFLASVGTIQGHEINASRTLYGQLLVDRADGVVSLDRVYSQERVKIYATS